MTFRTRTRGSRYLSSALVALTLLTVAAAASADAADEAKARFGRGVELYKEGDYRAALIEFRRAHELAPNYKVLFNIGQANLELSDYAGALTAFRRYLDEGKAEVPADKRKVVEAELRKLESRVARVTIKADVDGAEIAVDDVVVGKTPLAEAVLVSAGRRRISLARAGLPVTSKLVDLAGGDKPTITFEGAAGATAIAAPPPAPSFTALLAAPPPPPPPARSNTPVWIGLTFTGAFTVGAGVWAGLAYSAKGDLDDQLDRVPGNPASIGSARDKVKRLSLIADGMGIAAVVSGGITTYLALRPAATTTVGVGPTSVSFATSF